MESGVGGIVFGPSAGRFARDFLEHAYEICHAAEAVLRACVLQRVFARAEHAACLGHFAAVHVVDESYALGFLEKVAECSSVHLHLR